MAATGGDRSQNFMSSCWIEVDLGAIRSNYSGIVRLAGEGSAVIAVVKANAYGLGAGPVARCLEAAGCPMLAVTRVDEARDLRTAGVTAPILLLAPAAADETTELAALDLTATIGAREDIDPLVRAARAAGRRVRCHLKVNTGMNRFGVAPAEATAVAAALSEHPELELEGAFTHFADAGAENPAGARAQFQSFRTLFPSLAPYTTRGLFHCANSAALVQLPETRLLAVRPGTLLYGQFPNGTVSARGKAQGLELSDPFAVKARIVAIQEVPAGQKVGYGGEYTAKGATRLAILACGYADGLTLEPRARTETPLGAVRTGLERAARLLKMPQSGRLVTVHGKKVPLVGRIAMQTCTVDISTLPQVQVGDEVILPMRRVTAGAHIPRVYLNSGS